MLAYVFWHWVAEGRDTTGYECTLARFHRGLTEHPPPGFVGCFGFRLSDLPSWLPRAGTVYEDWYLVNDFTALGTLNEHAASGGNKVAHDDVARGAVAGAGGLYRLRMGQRPTPSAVRYATWFSKPRGVPYDDFYRAVPQAAIAEGASVWERQMNLGPALECCLLAASPVSVPGALDTAVIPLAAAYPSE